MKTTPLTTTIFAFAISLPMSAATVFTDDFESYAPGSNLRGQGGWVEAGITANPNSVVTIASGTFLGSQLVDGRAATGLFQENLLEHPVVLGSATISTLRFTGYSSSIAPWTRNQSVGFVPLGRAIDGSVPDPTGTNYQNTRWGPGILGWDFIAGPNLIFIPGGFDRPVDMKIIVDRWANTIYGQYDFGSGWMETPHYAFPPEYLAALNAIQLYVDHRFPNSFTGMEVDNITVTASDPATECGGGVVLENRLTAPDAHSFDSFGSALSISGDSLIIGAPAPFGPNTPTDREGAAYVFRRTGVNWNYEARFSVTESGDRYFASAVAISEDVAVVTGINTFSAYVYRSSAGVWTQEAQLFPDPETAPGANYGRTIAVKGDTVVVGSPRDMGLQNEAGAVYVFRRINGQWLKEAKLAANDGLSGEEFGHSVALNGDTIVVGAILSNARGTASGAVYVFRRNGGAWTQEAKLVGNDTARLDTLGCHVAISGNRIVAGAEQAGNFRGAAYIFKFDGTTWNQETKLVADDGISFDAFGSNVAIDNNTLTVGARFRKCNNVAIGTVYVFELVEGEWSQKAKLLPVEGHEADQFGWTLAMDNGTLLVGAVSDDLAVPNGGAVYVQQIATNCLPTISCSPDLTDVPTDVGQCYATGVNLGSPIIGGDCGIASVSNNAPVQFLKGDTLVTWTATDIAGNTVSCTQKVTVRDHEAPIVSCPVDITVPCSVDLLVPVTFSATVTDNCDPAPNVTFSIPSGSGFPVGNTTVVCTATDTDGNDSTCSFNVLRAPLVFSGFLPPIDGSDSTGGSFAEPVRAFKLNSTIRVAFTATCGGSPVVSGVHRLQATKYSSETTSDDPIDVTAQGGATVGNEFQLVNEEWRFNLSIRGTGMTIGIWQLVATLSDGSQHTVWIQIK